MSHGPWSQHQLTKARCAALAIARGVAVVRLGCDVYTVRPGGVLVLLVRARGDDDVWERACEVLEAV